MLAIYLLTTFIMVAGATIALRATSLIRAAIGLFLGNAALAALFFLLRAPYAGSVQLSVGAGLMSVLFLIAVGLIEPTRGSTDEP